jgi:hypothetical protein
MPMSGLRGSRRGNAQVWFLKCQMFELYPTQVVEGDLEAAAGGDLVAFMREALDD